MACQYLYKCKDCDFQIQTNDDGSDMVERGSIYLCKCNSCNSLVEHFESMWIENVIFTEKTESGFLSNKHRDHKRHCQRIEFVRDNNKRKEVPEFCPKCRALNSLKRWKPSEGCPHCGGEMERDDNTLIYTD